MLAYKDARPQTSKLLEMITAGMVSADTVVEMALCYMSEADVADMMLVNDMDLPEDQDDDGQPDEAQEWESYDPDC